MSARSIVPVHVSGSLAAASLLWTHRGALLVTVVLKTAYALVAGPAAAVAPDPVDDEDRHYRDDPARAVRSASDLAPRIPRAEIVHAGAVFAPAGITMVRLALVRGGQTVLEKRALAQAASDSPGLGPRGRTSAERVARLGGAAPPVTDAQGVLALPDDFDFAFHQAAPADQQCDRLVGGDQILLGNLHPDAADLGFVLPSRAPAARALLGGEQAPLVIECKRVVIDTDRRRCTLVWLAELELPGLDAVPHLRLEARAPDAPLDPVAPAPPAFAAHEILRRIAASGAAPTAPAHAPAQPAAAAPAHAPARTGAAGTVVMDSITPAPAPKPFVTTGTVFLEDAPAPAPPAPGTMFLDDPAAPTPTAALPFAARPPAPAAPPRLADGAATPWGNAPIAAAPRAPMPGAATMAIDVEVAPPPSAPAFHARALAAPPPPFVPPPNFSAPPPPAFAPPEPPPDFAAPEPPRASAPRPAIAADPWAKAAPEAAPTAAPQPPPQPKAAPKADALKLLYKRLK